MQKEKIFSEMMNGFPLLGRIPYEDKTPTQQGGIRMKKKVLAGILIGLVVLAVGATSAFAAGTGGWHHLSGGRGSCDGTGICTNCGSIGCHGSC